MPTTKMTRKLGLDGPISINGAPAQYITGPTITLSYDQEEAGIVAAGIVKSFVNGQINIAISFTMKNFQDASGNLPADVAAIHAAFASGTSIPFSASDTALGTLSGDVVVSKCDENRELGKVISWSVELKPTFEGTAFTIGGATQSA